MDAAAPEAAEPQEAAEQAEPRKRSWRRVKIPTSVVVSLAGIALTAWLLPAFTRQWDDRQKAREVKADLVAQMSSAMVTAVVTARRLAFAGRYAEQQAGAGAWLLANLSWRLGFAPASRLIVALCGPRGKSFVSECSSARTDQRCSVLFWPKRSARYA